MVSVAKFRNLLAFLWPIERHEIKKIVPMMIMMFLICFNHSILRNAKDALVITAKSSGVEVIPFIKVWVLLPMAILITLIFTKLSNRFSQEKVFYIITSSFLLFFGLFIIVIYPLQDYVHPHNLASQLETVLPAGFKGWIAMMRNWSFTLFYVISELWGSMVLSVLFWGFANEITTMTEARRFYSMLGVVASSASIVSGLAANTLTEGVEWESTLQILIGVIITCGCLTMLVFRYMNKTVLQGEEFKDLHSVKNDSLPKKKLSLQESFAYLANSKHLICIATLVVCYNLVINLVELVWKDQVHQLYQASVDYNRYMNYNTSIVGLIATLTSLCMVPLIARFGWTYIALITPLMMLLTSVGFFGFMLLRADYAQAVVMFTGTMPLAIAVFFGAAQVCLSKACKYSVFDATKEMAFIPLSHELKLKGKAAIDGVGSRLGKSGGSLIHQGLLMIFATMSASAPYVAVVLSLVICGWMYAVRILGKQIKVAVAREKTTEATSFSLVDNQSVLKLG